MGATPPNRQGMHPKIPMRAAEYMAKLMGKGELTHADCQFGHRKRKESPAFAVAETLSRAFAGVNEVMEEREYETDRLAKLNVQIVAQVYEQLVHFEDGS